MVRAFECGFWQPEAHGPVTNSHHLQLFLPDAVAAHSRNPVVTPALNGLQGCPVGIDGKEFMGMVLVPRLHALHLTSTGVATLTSRQKRTKFGKQSIAQPHHRSNGTGLGQLR